MALKSEQGVDEILGKTIEIFPGTRDHYERTMVWVFVDEKILNLELLRADLT